MQIAKAYKLKSIAFPAISCGVYGFPIHKACEIAIHEVLKAAQDTFLEQVVFACFNNETENSLNNCFDKLSLRHKSGANFH